MKGFHKEKLINKCFIINVMLSMNQKMQELNDVERITVQIAGLYENADIVGEINSRFNVIMINGIASVDRLVEFLEKTGFSRADVNQELEYAIIDDNEYLAYYIVNEKWANDNVMVLFTYWIDVENGNITTRLKDIVIRSKNW